MHSLCGRCEQEAAEWFRINSQAAHPQTPAAIAASSVSGALRSLQLEVVVSVAWDLDSTRTAVMHTRDTGGC